MLMLMKKGSICKNLTSAKNSSKQSMAMMIPNKLSIADFTPKSKPGIQFRKLSVFNEDANSRCSVSYGALVQGQKAQP